MSAAMAGAAGSPLRSRRFLALLGSSGRAAASCSASRPRRGRFPLAATVAETKRLRESFDGPGKGSAAGRRQRRADLAGAARLSAEEKALIQEKGGLSPSGIDGVTGCNHPTSRSRRCCPATGCRRSRRYCPANRPGSGAPGSARSCCRRCRRRCPDRCCCRWCSG